LAPPAAGTSAAKHHDHYINTLSRNKDTKKSTLDKVKANRVTITTGAALANKNTSPEQLTTQNGCH